MVGKTDDAGIIELAALVQRLEAAPPDAQTWALFLDGLRRGLSATGAAKLASTTSTLAHRRRKANPKFAEAWDEAVEAGTDRLEDLAYDRAAKTSDWLLIQLLKARRPEKFGDRVQVTERKEISWEPLEESEWERIYSGPAKGKPRSV